MLRKLAMSCVLQQTAPKNILNTNRPSVRVLNIVHVSVAHCSVRCVILLISPVQSYSPSRCDESLVDEWIFMLCERVPWLVRVRHMRSSDLCVWKLPVSCGVEFYTSPAIGWCQYRSWACFAPMDRSPRSPRYRCQWEPVLSSRSRSRTCWNSSQAGELCVIGECVGFWHTWTLQMTFNHTVYLLYPWWIVSPMLILFFFLSGVGGILNKPIFAIFALFPQPFP